MTRTYYLSDSALDIPGVTGDKFEVALNTEASATGALNLSFENNHNFFAFTLTSYAATPAGDPGADGATGDYSVEVNVTTADANMSLRLQLRRINSSGDVQASSGILAQQGLDTIGVKTFSATGVDLGTWVAGDRLRVDFQFRNISQHGADELIDIATNDTDAEVVTPFSEGATPIEGALAETQDDQTLAAAGQIGFSGSLDEAQDDQTLAASGQLGFSGSLAETQDDQTLAASGQLGHSGSLAETQDDQTLAASGTVTGEGNSGALNETQDDQTLAASGQIGFSGALDETQDDQTLAASGQLGLAGALAETQDDQTLGASGQIGFFGALAETQDDQTLAAAGTVGTFDPPNAAVNIVGSTAELTWDASPTPGVVDYSVFRRTGSSGTPFDPEVDEPIATGIETTSYDDEGLAAGDYEWQIFGRVVS